MRQTGLLAALVLATSAFAANPDDPAGQVLYVTSPACGHYKCVVTWNLGESELVNWLAPPAGNVSVSLASNSGGPVYTIAPNIPGTAPNNLCDAGQGFGVPVSGTSCGAVQFTIPLGWQLGSNYTIVVQSLSDSSIAGYTDAITLAAANGSTAAAPTGTQVAIVSATTAVSGYLSATASSTMSSSMSSAASGGGSLTSPASGGASGAVATAASAASPPSSSSSTPKNGAGHLGVGATLLAFAMTGSILFKL